MKTSLKCPAMRQKQRQGVAQRGYSLIETVVVTAVLGGLSATAMPKFAGLPSEARTSVVKSMEGAVRASSGMVHMACIAKSSCIQNGGEASLPVDGGAVVTVSNGYPQSGVPSGIESAIEFAGFTAVQQSGVTSFQKDGAPNPAACAVSYAQPQVNGTLPQIGSQTSGC